MSWYFDQSTGKQYDSEFNLYSTGYAGGNCGDNPEGVNNPALQAAHGVGPLPVGGYTFGTPEDSPKLGPFAIPLIPDSTNNMYGRSGFFCHGDNSHMNQSASEGCDVQPRTTREAMWSSTDHHMQVVASMDDVVGFN